jgi:hypothetical protein
MKIKKILLIICLTLSLTFVSLNYQQKKAEAIAPWVAYVAINAAISLAVGAVMYYFDSAGNGQMQTITAVDTNTGQVDFDVKGSGSYVYPIWTSTVNGKKIYPVDGATFTALDAAWTWNAQTFGMTQEWCDIQLNQPGVEFGYYASTAAYHFAKYTGGDLIVDGVQQSTFQSVPVPGGLGNSFSGTIDDFPVEFYEFLEDVPPAPDCFDGIQNQDETGIDCGGVCELNFGLVCPPAETCFDGIMNQDETGIDYGGVCGTETPVSQPPGNFTDANQDGIDDISGLDNTGSIPVGSVSGSIGTADSSTYDASLPGDVSEVGETDWTGLITGYLASNPLVLLATGSQINVTGATCSLPMTLFGKSMTIDFCSLDWMVDLFGSFVLGLMAIRAVFIAMGI